MAESVVQRATRQLDLTAVEILQAVPGAGTTQTLTNSAFNISSVNFTPSSNPPVSRAAYIDETVLPMTGALVTIDLTDCPGGSQDNIDATGKKLQRLTLINDGNATITIGPGSSDKYHPFGTDKNIDLPPGAGGTDSFLDLWFNDGLADVAAAVKNLGLTATAGASYKLALWFG